jgi:V-type H+-transporting ATPase subunit C
MEVAGEYQQLMEQEFFDFVLFEVPWIVNWHLHTHNT